MHLLHNRSLLPHNRSLLLHDRSLLLHDRSFYFIITSTYAYALQYAPCTPVRHALLTALTNTIQAKETYFYGKRDLLIWQKRPAYCTQTHHTRCSIRHALFFCFLLRTHTVYNSSIHLTYLLRPRAIYNLLQTPHVSFLHTHTPYNTLHSIDIRIRTYTPHLYTTLTHHTLCALHTHTP